MKIKTAALREKVDAAIKQYEATSRQRYADDVVKHEDAVAAYRKSGKIEQLRAELARLNRAAGRRIVTQSELDDAFHRWSGPRHGYDGPSAPTPLPAQIEPPRELAALRDYLDTVADDEISTNTLRELGFRTLAHILR